MTTLSDDALQRRIARLAGAAPPPHAINPLENLCLGTSLGSVRKENQDRALFVWAFYPEAPDRNFGLAVLSDGMGGLTHGSEAATIGLSAFVTRVLRTSRSSPADRLLNAAVHANDAIYGQFGGRSGATLSAVLLTRGGTFGVNVGDSRIYSIGARRELVQLSKDDTLAGVLGKESRNDENNSRLVQYLGMGEGLEPNLITQFSRGIEAILLTSDGAHGVPSEALARVARQSRSESELTYRLLSLSDLLGGQDNGTVVAIGKNILDYDGGSAFGLTLAFASVSERLEIWIPVLGEDARQERLRAPANGEVPPPPAQARAPEEPAVRPEPERRSRKKRKSGGQSGQAAKQDPRLPLEGDEERPVLDVRFPRSE